VFSSLELYWVEDVRWVVVWLNGSPLRRFAVIMSHSSPTQAHAVGVAPFNFISSD